MTDWLSKSVKKRLVGETEILEQTAGRGISLGEILHSTL